MTTIDTPMLRQYREIKAKAEDAILFFRLGDFYEMFLTDAEKASRELDITLTGRGKDDNRVPMCGIPYHAAEGYIQRLVSRGYKVAICEQVEEATGKGLTRREIVRVVTPGTITGQGALDEKTNNYLLAVVGCHKTETPHLDLGVRTPEQKKTYGVSFLDLSTGEYRIGMFSEPDFLALLDRISPREMLVDQKSMLSIGNASETDILQNRIDMLSHTDARKRLSTHFGEHAFSGMGISHMADAFPAAWALLHYVMTTQRSELQHITRLRGVGVSGYLFMDRVTIQNLELIQPRGQDFGKKTTLYGILDETRTAMGGRKLKQLIQYPLADPLRIQARLDALESLFQDRLSREEIRVLLENVYDIERLLGRIVTQQPNPRELIALKQTIASLAMLPTILVHLTGELFARYQSLFAYFSEPDNVYIRVMQLIESAINDPSPVTIRDGGVIRAGFSTALDDLMASFQEVREWIQGLEGAERDATGIKSLKVGYTKVFGYYIEVPNAQLSKVPQHYIRKQTLANAERFITPELKEKESFLLNGEENQRELEAGIYAQVVASVLEAVGEFQTLASAVAEIDCLQALATVSVRHGYTRPLFVPEPGKLHFIGSRHPILERDTTKPFIPNEVCMHQESRFLLITGPNMAGKSTLMRQVALTVIMAQIGCFVPAERAELSVVDKLFTRIGALDNLYFGQSTFMVEMLETATILNNATSQSLIVLDEVGRGTSTFDGMSLAAAISHYLYDSGARTMFATHYHELTVLADRFPAFRNYAMQIQETPEGIVFTHRFLEGAADKSYGIHVAQMAGLPEKIIRQASDLLVGFERDGAKYLKEAGVF